MTTTIPAPENTDRLPERSCYRARVHKAHTEWTPVPLVPEYRCPGLDFDTWFERTQDAAA
jgi:hypothetical protein